MKFEEVYEDFKLYASKRHKKQGFDTISRNFEKHILLYFKSSDIQNITKLDIINWQNEILTKNYSNSFNSILYYCFKSFLKYCANCSYIQENIVSSIEPFKKKIEYKEHNVYTLNEFRKFRSKLDNYVIKQYFNFMYFYGTRPSEAMALRLSDCKGKYIKINHSIHRRGNRELDTPKNQSSIRTIKINLLMRFRIWTLKCCYLKLYGDCNCDYFIFGGIKPLSSTTIDRYKKKACERANIYEITQHEFRHSYATRMIHKKVPIDYVSCSMGHSRVSTTIDIYLHPNKKSENHSFSEINLFRTIGRKLEKISQSIITHILCNKL